MGIPVRRALMAIAIAALPVSLAMAGKATVRYGVDRRVFRVCNLLLPGGYVNANPYLFIALEHSPLKPPGWEFENPLAVPYVEDKPGSSLDMYDQWRQAAHAPDAGSGPNYWTQRGLSPGDPLNKSWPQYWEVYFDSYTARRLRDFDLIYVSQPTINLSSASLRRALIDAVREGATLWIDSGGAAFQTDVQNLEPPRVDNPGGPWVPFRFAMGGAANYYRQILDASHNIFIEPFRLTPGETYYIGDLPEIQRDVSGGGGWVGMVPADGEYIDLAASSGPLDQVLVPILGTAAYGSGNPPTPSIAVCSYGAGKIIVTCHGIGDDVEEWFISGQSGPDETQAPDVKLAYNILAWGTAWEGPRQASNNLGYTNASCVPPLDIVWQFPAPQESVAASIGPIGGPVVVSHGCVYAAANVWTNNIPAKLLCFDADPQRDLDGDGLADDGIPDYSVGAPYDLVWSVDFSALFADAQATPRGAGVAVGYTPYDGRLVVVCTAVSLNSSVPVGYVGAVDARTGAPVWVFHVTPFRSGAKVLDISTPVIHGGWVYFVCSEVDNAKDGNPGSLTVDDLYGRAWCIDLQTGGGAIPAPAGYDTWGVWCYPDPDLDDNGTTDPTDTEYQGVLPPFAEPDWLIGAWYSPSVGTPVIPPAPGVIPTITTYTRNADDSFTEAVMTVGTPVRVVWDSTAGVSRIGRMNRTQPYDRDGIPNARYGGRDLALIPTPGRNDGGVMRYFLNENYYRLYARGVVASVSQVARRDDPTIATTEAYPYAPGSSHYIIVPPHAARYLLSATSATINTPLRPPLGLNMLLDYSDGANNITGEVRWLRGVIPWRTAYGMREQRVTPAAIRNRKLYAVTTIPEAPDDAYPPGEQSRIVAQDLRTNAREWQFAPLKLVPETMPVNNRCVDCKAAAAVSHDTVVTAMCLRSADNTDQPVGIAFGLRTEPVLTISLPGRHPEWGVARGVPNPNDPNADHRRPVTVKIISRGGAPPSVVDPWQYEIDYNEATITIDWERAYGITVDGGTYAGHIYGEPLLITWLSDNGTPEDPSDDVWLDDRLYVVPPLSRFVYAHGFIKLHYYPVNFASVVITTPEGLPVRGFQPGETVQSYDLDGDGSADPIVPRGWIDLRNAYVDENNNGAHDPGEPRLREGTVIEVSYLGFHNDWGAVSIPNPTLNLPREKHQVPVGFGFAFGGVAMAGSAMHFGTVGYMPPGGGQCLVPPGGISNQESLVSLLWDPASGLLRGWTEEPMHRTISPTPTMAPRPIAMPAATSQGLFAAGLLTYPGVEPFGWVSRLSTRRTLIVDGSRIIECAGQQVEWEMTATRSWEYGVGAQNAPVAVPLNQPAKVTSVGNNLLIVDTGNDRVVEVDRSGNVLWPLDRNGFNFYSAWPGRSVSVSQTKLRLRRPNDAVRFYTLADMNGDGSPEQVANTVIADTGNARVVRVRTWWEWSATGSRWYQEHRVETVTPPYLRDPTNPQRRVRARYTHVAIIPDPATGQLAGYLCAAPNLHELVVIGYVNGQLVVNPPADAPMPGGANTWAVWAWLYDPDVSDAVQERNDPLLFAGIRSMTLTRHGKIYYLDVACSQYRGRLSQYITNKQPFYSPDPGAGVFEFRVVYDGAASGLMPSEEPAGTLNPDAPHWRFTQVEYSAMQDPATGVHYFQIPLPNGSRYVKRFLPTCCQVLMDGSHLIANNSGLIERLTKSAIRRTGVVCTPEVFVVDTDDQGDNYAGNDAHVVDPRKLIPDPYGPDWPDPLTMPNYAERVVR